MSFISPSEVAEIVQGFDAIDVAFLFGSALSDKLSPASDLDVAVAGRRALGASQKQQLMDALAAAFGLPVDVIDLQTATGEISIQALTTGKRLFCRDQQVLESCIRKMWEQEVGILPLYRAAMREKLDTYLHEQQSDS